MATALSSTTAGGASAAAAAARQASRVQAKRRGRIWRGAVLLLLMVGVLGSGSWAMTHWTRRANLRATVDKFSVELRTFSVVLKEKGELKAAKSTDIISEIEGRTRIISLIAEGTPVKEGDLLIVLASDQIDEKIRQEELKEANAITAFESSRTELEIQRDKNLSDIRKAELEIELAQLGLERYEKGDWEQQLKDAQIAIDQARIALQRRTQDYSASKQLKEKSYITETEFKEDEFNYQKAEWDLEKAEKALVVLNTYTHTVELRKREADRDEAVKEAARVRKNAAAEEKKKERALEGAEKELSIIVDQLAKLRSQKEKCRISAPTQGFVVYYSGGGGGFRMMSSDSQIREGAEVFERQILMQLPDTAKMTAVVRIHEAKTDKLRMDQSVALDVEGVPGKRFTGKVTKIAALADTQNRWLNPDLKEYETEIALDPTDIPLKPGTTAHCEIFVETVENRLAVPVQSVFSKGGKRFVFKDDSKGVSPHEVKLGAVGMEYVEVTQGITANERILLAPSDEHKRLLPEAGPGERGGPGRMGGPRSAERPPGVPPTGMPANARGGARPVMIQMPASGADQRPASGAQHAVKQTKIHGKDDSPERKEANNDTEQRPQPKETPAPKSGAGTAGN